MCISDRFTAGSNAADPSPHVENHRSRVEQGKQECPGEVTLLYPRVQTHLRQTVIHIQDWDYMKGRKKKEIGQREFRKIEWE